MDEIISICKKPPREVFQTATGDCGGVESFSGSYELRKDKAVLFDLPFHGHIPPETLVRLHLGFDLARSGSGNIFDAGIDSHLAVGDRGW